MNYKKALEKVDQKVSGDFEKADLPGLIFHNLRHTKMVVSRTKKIAKHYDLKHETLFILLTSAWFHDIGYLSGDAPDHEERGAEIAITYLSSEGFDDDLILSVARGIKATELHREPEDFLGEILCDADLYHWGTKSFFKVSKLVKKELEWHLHQKISKEDWIKQTIALFEAHHFRTTFCQEKLEARKQKNLQKLRDKLAAIEKKKAGSAENLLPSKQHEKKKLMLN